MVLKDVMTSDVLTTSPDASVTEAARAMTERHVGSAVVVDKSGLVGIITERDVLRAAASGKDLGAEPVEGWMTADPLTVGIDEPPSTVASEMQKRGFRHFPVVDGDELVGIVSMRDLWQFAFLPPEPDDMTMRH